MVVAGHVCLDITPRFYDTGAREISRIVTPGKLVNVGNAAISTGGAVSNTGLGLIRLGIKTALMGKCGNDILGNGIRRILMENGAGETLSVTDGEETSYSIVLAPPGIDRIFLHHPGANDTFCSGDVNYEIVSRARHFHFGYPPLMKRLYENEGAELIDIFRRVKRLGVTTSLDMTLPDPDSESGRVNWRGILDSLLPLVDIAAFSAEEIMFMLNRARFEALKADPGSSDPLDAFTHEDFRLAGHELRARGAKIALVKCGSRGMLLRTADERTIGQMGAGAPRRIDSWSERELWEEAFHVERVVSTTGAGDSAIAGFLSGLLRGWDPEDTLAAAGCAGAQNVLALDAISGLHSWEQTAAMIPGWRKSRENPGPGWHYDETRRIWRGASDSSRGCRIQETEWEGR